MKMQPIARPAPEKPGFREFVALVAALMAMNALAIDTMLPALPAMGRTLGVVQENDRQLVVTFYVFGLGLGQIFYGPISDRFGRRAVLIPGICAYVLFSVIVSLAGSFELLLAGRTLQGLASASTRVLAVSIVRDRYSGRTMARVTSLAFMTFLLVPIIAPSVGQAILLVAPWRWIFGMLTLFGLIVLVWAGLRLPETLHSEYRRPIDLGAIAGAFRIALTTRLSIGYTIVVGLLSGIVLAYISSVQQIFAEVLGAPRQFTLVFALAAGGMALASLINARIVERLGTRRVSHAAVIALVLVNLVHLGIAASGHETVMNFALLQTATLFCIAISTANFSAIAMEPLAAIAGTAASAQGFLSTVLGTFLGWLIARQFNGSVVPIIAGFVALGIASLVLILITERGRLFHPQLGA